MKTNAFIRLIRTVACGIAVLGAANAIGQESPTENDGGSIAGDTFGISEGEVYYPPGMEIPLTETEIPGSAYFIGPDGERIDAATLMNQATAGQEIEIQGQDSLPGLATGQSFSVDGVYDGTLSFPMGTFPTTPFGERILSEVPSDKQSANESQSGEIKGALITENGNPVDVSAGDGEAPRIENGVPEDQIVRPDNSPTSDGMKEVAEATTVIEEEAPGEPVAVIKPNEAGGVRSLKNEVKIFRDPSTGQVTLIGDVEDVALVANSMEDLAKQAPKAMGEKYLNKKAEGRQNRIKQRLQDALGEKERLNGLLRKANRKTEALTKEVSKLKAGGKKPKADSDKSVEQLQAKLKTAETEKADLLKLVKVVSEKAKVEISQAAKKLDLTENKLKQIQSERLDMAEAFQIKEKELTTQLKRLQSEAQKNASQAEAKIAAAEANVEKVKADMLAVTKKLEHELEVKAAEAKAWRLKSDAKIAQAQANAEKARAEALSLTQKMAAGAAAMANAPATDATGVVSAPTSDELAKKAREAKAAAELEVSRKLKSMEERKKAADAAKAAAEETGAEKSGESKTAEEADGKEPVLSLDDQIKRLKEKRDQQIAESETRIRAKQQREIDKLLEEGKAVDSDEVKAAVEKMKEAIKTSEEKLRSRFLRRLERLKEDMKKSLK